MTKQPANLTNSNLNPILIGLLILAFALSSAFGIGLLVGGLKAGQRIQEMQENEWNDTKKPYPQFADLKYERSSSTYFWISGRAKASDEDLLYALLVKAFGERQAKYLISCVEIDPPKK